MSQNRASHPGGTQKLAGRRAEVTSPHEPHLLAVLRHVPTTPLGSPTSLRFSFIKNHLWTLSPPEWWRARLFGALTLVRTDLLEILAAYFKKVTRACSELLGMIDELRGPLASLPQGNEAGSKKNQLDRTPRGPPFPARTGQSTRRERAQRRPTVQRKTRPREERWHP